MCGFLQKGFEFKFNSKMSFENLLKNKKEFPLPLSILPGPAFPSAHASPFLLLGSAQPAAPSIPPSLLLQGGVYLSIPSPTASPSHWHAREQRSKPQPLVPPLPRSPTISLCLSCIRGEPRLEPPSLSSFHSLLPLLSLKTPSESSLELPIHHHTMPSNRATSAFSLFAGEPASLPSILLSSFLALLLSLASSPHAPWLPAMAQL